MKIGMNQSVNQPLNQKPQEPQMRVFKGWLNNMVHKELQLALLRLALSYGYIIDIQEFDGDLRIKTLNLARRVLEEVKDNINSVLRLLNELEEVVSDE